MMKLKILSAKLWKWKIDEPRACYTRAMPKIFRLCVLIIALSVLTVRFTSLITASTDPQYATSSATATIPETTGSTTDESGPTAPILIRPEDGTTTGDNKVEFVWRQSSDPN